MCAWSRRQLSVAEDTYAASMEGAEGCDATWMLEDVDCQNGASPGVLNLDGNLAYVNAQAYGAADKGEGFTDSLLGALAWLPAHHSACSISAIVTTSPSLTRVSVSWASAPPLTGKVPL